MYVIPLLMYDAFMDSKMDFVSRQHILYVGGFTHVPNRDAVLWFAQQVFPKVLKHIPDMKFFVIGSNPPQEILALQSEQIIVTGYVSDEELMAYYQQIKVVVIPLRYGAGVKGKLLEAMYSGVPVVATGIALEGIPEIEQVIAPHDTAGDFADELLRIYHDHELLQARSLQYRQYVKTHCSKEQAMDTMQSILKTFEGIAGYER